MDVLESPAQDALPALLKPPWVACAEHILRNFAKKAWYSHIAIDRCYVLLATKLERQTSRFSTKGIEERSKVEEKYTIGKKIGDGNFAVV